MGAISLSDPCRVPLLTAHNLMGYIVYSTLVQISELCKRRVKVEGAIECIYIVFVCLVYLRMFVIADGFTSVSELNVNSSLLPIGS